MSDKTCPACSSSNLKKGTVKDKFTDNFGGSIEFEIIEYTCEDCDSTGDFFKENDELLAKKAQELNEKAVLSILEYFANNHVSFASIERVLGLSQRTLTKWKNEVSAPTSAGIALMKFIKTFPWLLEVADEKFENSAAQKIHMDAFIKTLMSQTSLFKDGLKNADYLKTQHIDSFAVATSLLMQNNLANFIKPNLTALPLASTASLINWAIPSKKEEFCTNESAKYVSITV